MSFEIKSSIRSDIVDWVLEQCELNYDEMGDDWWGCWMYTYDINIWYNEEVDMRQVTAYALSNETYSQTTDTNRRTFITYLPNTTTNNKGETSCH